MPYRRRFLTKALGPAIATLAGLTACLGQNKAPEIITGSEAQVEILADLDNSPNPLAKSHCAQFGKRPRLNDTSPVADNHLSGWATGTKVFTYTFECH
jgi:hypothetical protein